MGGGRLGVRGSLLLAVACSSSIHPALSLSPALSLPPSLSLPLVRAHARAVLVCVAMCSFELLLDVFAPDVLQTFAAS